MYVFLVVYCVYFWYLKIYFIYISNIIYIYFFSVVAAVNHPRLSLHTKLKFQVRAVENYSAINFVQKVIKIYMHIVYKYL